MDTVPHDHQTRLAVGLEILTSVQQLGASLLPDSLLVYDRADFRTAALGTFVEIAELVNECQWKPWRVYADPTPEERERVLKEFGDVLHFIAWMVNNLRDRFDLDERDLARAFLDAAAENRRRFAGEVPGREPPTDDTVDA